MKRIVVSLLVVLASAQVAFAGSQALTRGGGNMNHQHSYGRLTTPQILAHRPSLKLGSDRLNRYHPEWRPTAAQILALRRSFKFGGGKINPYHSDWRRGVVGKVPRGLSNLLGVGDETPYDLLCLGDESPYNCDWPPTAAQTVILVLSNDNAMPSLPSYSGGRVSFDSDLPDSELSNFTPPWRGQIRHRREPGPGVTIIRGYE